ncbi:PLP-binding barrel [Sesbania bispinosa]|nr:PLP-binding barrel [Sesbania bispinosa]
MGGFGTRLKLTNSRFKKARHQRKASTKVVLLAEISPSSPSFALLSVSLPPEIPPSSVAMNLAEVSSHVAAATSASASSVSIVSESSSLFLMHEIDDNIIAKLEWKPSPDPFHFGCFESIQVQHQIPVAVSAPSNKVANQSMSAEFISVSEDSMDLSLIVEVSYANRNGSKDVEYIFLALVARKLTLNTVIDLSRKMRIRSVIGMRAKLQTKHTGHFVSISGDKKRFGLTTAHILRMVKKLEHVEMMDCLQLLHFHIPIKVFCVCIVGRKVLLLMLGESHREENLLAEMVRIRLVETTMDVLHKAEFSITRLLVMFLVNFTQLDVDIASLLQTEDDKECGGDVRPDEFVACGVVGDETTCSLHSRSSYDVSDVKLDEENDPGYDVGRDESISADP